jgi:hypothetical protein
MSIVRCGTLGGQASLPAPHDDGVRLYSRIDLDKRKAFVQLRLDEIEFGHEIVRFAGQHLSSARRRPATVTKGQDFYGKGNDFDPFLLLDDFRGDNPARNGIHKSSGLDRSRLLFGGVKRSRYGRELQDLGIQDVVNKMI